MALSHLTAGAVSLEGIFPALKLESLPYLSILKYAEQVAAPEIIQQLCPNAEMLTIYIECPMERLFPARAPWHGLPRILQLVSLISSMEKGIPMALEQLPILNSLDISHNGEGRMHLDRPLDPFVDMESLEMLSFSSHIGKANGDGNWTLQALRLLGLAQKRVLHRSMTLGGKMLSLEY